MPWQPLLAMEPCARPTACWLPSADQHQFQILLENSLVVAETTLM